MTDHAASRPSPSARLTLAEPRRHGADDAQPRHRQRAQRPDGEVLRGARRRGPAHHRRRGALARRPGLRAHPRPLHRRAGGRLEARDRRRAPRGRAHLRAAHAHRAASAIPANLPAGARIVAPSAVAAPGQMWTDDEGMQPHPVPVEMTEADIAKAIGEYAARRAARHRRRLRRRRAARRPTATSSTSSSTRPPTSAPTAGAAASRTASASRWKSRRRRRRRSAPDRVGIRISPYGVFNGMAPDAEMDALYLALVRRARTRSGSPTSTSSTTARWARRNRSPRCSRPRSAPRSTARYILSGGYDGARAEADLAAGRGDLVAFGRPFISNPDLVRQAARRARRCAPRTPPRSTRRASAGYTDYPAGLAA